MEYQDRLPPGVAAYGRLGLLQAGSKEELFDVGCLVQVNSAPNMAPVELIVESTINDMIVGLLAVMAVEELVELKSTVRISKESVDERLFTVSGLILISPSSVTRWQGRSFPADSLSPKPGIPAERNLADGLSLRTIAVAPVRGLKSSVPSQRRMVLTCWRFA
jgi:hypothetical protein